MEINRRDFITKVSAIAALSVLPSSFVAAMGNEKVEKAKPKYPTLKCDVVVVGAGPGGVPAAIAAARQGAKVILLEEDNMPGGAPVDMYVPFIWWSQGGSVSGDDSGIECKTHHWRAYL